MGELFKPTTGLKHITANQYGPSVRKITKGSVIAFHYPMSLAVKPNIIHDHYPLVMVTDIWSKYIRGVNLHYLTYPYVRDFILKPHCNNMMFSYYHIKRSMLAGQYLANAFRTFVRVGMGKVKLLDCDILLKALDIAKSAYTPEEIKSMQKYIQETISRQMNPRPPRPGTTTLEGTLTRGYQEGLVTPPVPGVGGFINEGQ